jgi:hypothetical protein
VAAGWFTVRVEGLTLRMNGAETFRPREANKPAEDGVESDNLSTQSEEDNANAARHHRHGQGSHHKVCGFGEPLLDCEPSIC